MGVSPVMKLKNNLLEDKNYMQYKNLFKSKKIIDKNLLIKILDTHLDFYILFLKMNIFIYGYDTKKLNKELQDFLNYKNKNLRIDDLEIIFREYYKNFSMYRRSLETIIIYKLRNKNEINLLKQILNRPFEKELSAFFEYKIVPNDQQFYMVKHNKN